MDQTSFISPAAPLPAAECLAHRVVHDAAALTPSELLSLILSGPQALGAARELFTRYSLYQLPKATLPDLLAVRGLGPANARRVQALLALTQKIASAQPDERAQIRSPADVAERLCYVMSHLDQEYLYVILLDTRNRLIGPPIEVYHGSLNTSLIRVAEIFRDAVRQNAAAIIISHNHPSGDPSPSPEDVAVTRTVVEAGKTFDIEVLDHLVIGGNRWVSLKERGLGFST
jgi:DNA repair protein RadC